MSIKPYTEQTHLDGMIEPVLITAFSSQLKGGQTATAALAYALEQWDGRLVAEFDTDQYYINARMRPWVRRDGDKTVIDWPQNVVYRVDAPDRTVLILVGVEPSMNWRQVVAEIGDFAVKHDVRLAINLKSVAATVPHTLQAPVKAIYSDAAMLEDFAIEELEDQDGFADIGRVLNLHLASNGCKTIDIYAMEPFYTAAIPDAEASISLLMQLQRLLRLPVDTERIDRTAAVQREAIDAAVASSEQLAETVHALEQRARSAGGVGQALLAAPDAEGDLDAADVLNDAEEFLRSLRTGDDAANE
jgi:predicted ATP-grasp superfamily ATP-dependent carboligase